LYDVELKTKNIPRIILHGLAYFLTPPYLQDAKTTKKIEKRMRKECPALAPFFKLTKEIVDELLKTAKTAQSKKKSDYVYAARRIFSLTHRTKNIEKLLSDAFVPKGIKILDTEKYPDTNWRGGFNISIVMGRFVMYRQDFGATRSQFSGFMTKESFELSCWFMVGPATPHKAESEYSPAVVVRLWARHDDDQETEVLCSIYSHKMSPPNTAFLVRRKSPNKKESVASLPFSGPLFHTGQWYHLRYKYDYEKNVLFVFVNGRQSSRIHIRESARINPNGFIWLGQQEYEFIVYKDVYLSP
jgi:hypothetical protein